MHDLDYSQITGSKVKYYMAIKQQSSGFANGLNPTDQLDLTQRGSNCRSFYCWPNTRSNGEPKSASKIMICFSLVFQSKAEVSENFVGISMIFERILIVGFIDILAQNSSVENLSDARRSLRA